jgi:hypothetical protein
VSTIGTLGLHILRGRRVFLGVEVPDFSKGAALGSILSRMPELVGCQFVVTRRDPELSYLPFPGAL